MKFGQLIEYNVKYFCWKITYKMWWRNYSQILLWKIKVEYISGAFTMFLVKKDRKMKYGFQG